MLRTGSVVRKEQSFGAALFENNLVGGELYNLSKIIYIVI
jgi:hypothetical protein